MGLYEIVTGALGFSYVRAYVWAQSEARARELFRARHGERVPIEQVALLFSADAAPFCTDLDDEGWKQ